MSIQFTARTAGGEHGWLLPVEGLELVDLNGANGAALLDVLELLDLDESDPYGDLAAEAMLERVVVAEVSRAVYRHPRITADRCEHLELRLRHLAELARAAADVPGARICCS